MAEEQYVPKKYKRKHMWWRYLLVFVGGVLFTAVGAAAGAAVYATTVPVSQVVGLFPAELQGFLTYFSENGEETLYSTVMKFITDSETTVNELLDSIELPDVIPEDMFGDMKGLYQKLCYYKVPESATPAELKNVEYTINEGTEETDKFPGWKPITLAMLINGKVPAQNGTVDFFTNFMNGVVIKDILTEDILGSSNILNAIKECHLDEVEEEIMEAPINDLFDSDETNGIMKSIGSLSLNQLTGPDGTKLIYLADVLGINAESPQSAAKAICFGKTDGVVDYTKKISLADLSNLQDQILDKKVNELIDSSEGMMASIGELTLRELSGPDATKHIYLYSVLGVNETSGDKLTKLLCFKKNELGEIDYNQPRTIKDIENIQAIMDTLLLKDVIDCSGTDPILNALKDANIADLSTRIAALRLSDVFPTSDNEMINWLINEGGDPLVTNIDDEINKVPLGKVFDVTTCTGLAGGILTELKDTQIGNLGTAFNNVKLTKALASEIYEDDGTTLKAEWKYMLYEDLTASDASQKAIYDNYTLANFSALMTNIKNNMKVATLQQLNDDGFISADQTVLDKTVLYDSNLIKVGDMTISQLINYVGSVIPAV